MARSAPHCSYSHNHHRCHHHHRKLYSHNAHACAHNHAHNHTHHRHSMHVPEESHYQTLSFSQSETASTEWGETETTKKQARLKCPTTATTSIFGLRHEVHPLHVSVNLRLTGTNTVLLAEDLFIPLAGSESLTGIFEAAHVRYPYLLGRYILRKEKDVVVLCHDEEKNTYARTSMIFAALSRLRPIRLIFCVLPNVEVIRELDSQMNYTLKVNARTESDPECILEKDAIAEVQGNVSVGQLWAHVVKNVPQIRDLVAIGVLTRRSDDNVVVRFGIHDFVADLVKPKGRRFVFILSEHHLHGSNLHTKDESKQHRQNHKNDSDYKLRFKMWFRFRQNPCEHGRRKFRWGLIQKK